MLSNRRLYGNSEKIGMKVLFKLRSIFLHFIKRSDWLSNLNNYLTSEEYIKRCLMLNDLTLRDALMLKRVLFQRMPFFMQRDYLSLKTASDSDITAFMQKHHKVIGKCDLCGGDGMAIFSSSDSNLLEILKSKRIDILEEIIEQHPEYAAMNASSVNTFRIHTIRTTHGCKVFLYPKLRVGKAGEIVDLGVNHATSYRVLSDHNGYIISAYRKKKHITPCQEHQDTGYSFVPDKKLPFVSEAEQMCIEAAAKMPEARYIGWDVAVTSRGPVIVEANFISGAINTYQNLHYLSFGCGNGDEIKTMLEYGMENVVYGDKCKLCAVQFADLSYLSTCTATPDAGQQFMLLLHSALHNFGVEFVRTKDTSVNCEIMCDLGKKFVKFGKNIKRGLRLPEIIPNDIFSADILARDLAKKIYQELVK